MSSQIQELVSVLDEVVVLLDADRQARWSKWIRAARSRLIKSDHYSGAIYLLGAYGGMGSFNDLMLGDELSHRRFEQLRERAWELAEQIRKSLAIQS